MVFDRKNLIFDLGGVLLDIYPQRTFAAFAAMGIDPSLLTESNTLSDNVMLAFEHGNISSDELCAYIANLLPQKKREDFPVGQLNACIKDAWRALIGELPLYKWQRLSALRREGHNIFLLSNTNALHWEIIAKNISQLEGREAYSYFDKIFLSYEMHLCKPCEEIFRRVLSEACLSPCDTLFIDDSRDNCASAERVGLKTLLVERNSRWTNEKQ